MKILLRSTFISLPADDKDLFFRNFLELDQTRLGFESTEAQHIWEFIKQFATNNNHVPEFSTVRNHFEHRTRQLEVVDYLDTIAALPALTRGDFRTRLEHKVHDRRVKTITSLLGDTNAITLTGLQVRDPKGKPYILEGPIDAVRYFIDKSHDIVSPATGARLSGEVTADGVDVVDEYDQVKKDPRSGLGQMTGIGQMDEALKGAQKGALWIHAAFTGHLKSLFAVNWLYNQAIYYKENGLIFSLEMPYRQIRRMFYAIHSCHEKFKDIRIAHGLQIDEKVGGGIPYEGLRDGKLTDTEEWFFKEYVVPDFNDAANNYGKILIEVADPDKSDFTSADLRSKAELLHSKTPLAIVFVDHVLLMSSRTKYNSTTERLNEVVRDLKKISMNFNRGEGIPVVGLFQLSREGLKRVEKLREKDKDPDYSLFDLSYANECERSGDVITASYVNPELEAQNRVRFQCLKSRDNKKFESFYARVCYPWRRILAIRDEIEELEDGGAEDFTDASLEE